MRLNRTVGITALLLAVGMTAACDGDEKEATVKEKGDGNSVIVENEESDGAEEAADEEPEADDSTAQLGDTVDLGDWEVKVTKVQINANAAIEQANEFNDAPEGQYVLATYEATYIGSARTADAMMDLTWTFTGNDNQIYESSYAVEPGDEWPSSARKGGTVKQDVSFDVPKNVIAGGTLSVEALDSDFESTYADFLVN